MMGWGMWWRRLSVGSGIQEATVLTLDLTYEGQGVRIEGTPDNPLFRALDCCRVLGIANPNHAYSRIPEAMKITIADNDGNRRGNPNVVWLTESGVYRLVFESRKPEAEAFKDYLAETVLPSLRKHGCFPPPLHVTKSGNALVRADSQAIARIAAVIGPIQEDIKEIKVELGHINRKMDRVPQHRKDVKEHTKWQGLEVIRRKYDGKDPSDLITQILDVDGEPLDLEWDHWASRGLCSPEHVWPISRKNNRDLAEPGSPQRKAVEHLFRTYQQHRELMFGKGRPSDVKTARVKARQRSLFDAP